MREQLPVKEEGEMGKRRRVLLRGKVLDGGLGGQPAYPLAPGQGATRASWAARPASLLPSGSSPTPLLTPASPPVLAASKHHLHLCFSVRLAQQRKTPSFFCCGSSSGSSCPVHFCSFPALVFPHQRQR